MPQLNSGATPNLADIARALGGAGTPMPEGGEDWLKEHAPQVDFSALLPDEREEYAYWYPHLPEPARRAMWGRSRLTHDEYQQRQVYCEITILHVGWMPPYDENREVITKGSYSQTWVEEYIDLVPFNALA